MSSPVIPYRPAPPPPPQEDGRGTSPVVVTPQMLVQSTAAYVRRCRRALQKAEASHELEVLDALAAGVPLREVARLSVLTGAQVRKLRAREQEIIGP